MFIIAYMFPLLEFSYFLFSGIHRSVLSRNIYCGSIPKNFSFGANFTSWKLSPKYVEYHGFRSCSYGVSKYLEFKKLCFGCFYPKKKPI